MHEQFVTTTRGLDRDAPAMRLYEKAKKLGFWNPSDIDFTQDQQHWQAMSADEQDLILRLTALFQAGEEAVTLDLLPLMMVIAQEGRLEEEMFLTTFLFEEAKHTDFFHHFLAEVTGGQHDLSHYHTPNYQMVFYQSLPEALQALTTDPSPAAQARASVTYNMIVEGMLAETGYHAFFNMLERNELMPGLREGIGLLKRDESRHIAYGIYLLSRLAAEHPELWELIDETMNTLMLPALGVIQEAFAAYEVVPFGLVEDAFINYATMQFQKRRERILKSRGADIAAVNSMTHTAIDEDDA